MLRTSSSSDSLISTTQLAIKYDRVDGGGGKLVEKFQNVEKLSKIKKPQKPDKSAKVISSEKLSFLTSDTRLVLIKMDESHNEELLALLEAFKNWKVYKL